MALEEEGCKIQRRVVGGSRALLSYQFVICVMSINVVCRLVKVGLEWL